MQSGSHEFILINGVPVGREYRPYVLAEIGINHGGVVSLAEKLIKAASEAGADGVKFQTFTADDLVSREKSPEYWDLFKKCELDRSQHKHLRDVANDLGMAFLSTPFSFADADLLMDIGVPAIKIASGDLTNHPLLQYVGKLGLPVILSTGMSYLNEVRESREVLLDAGCPGIVLLHCVSRYPAQPEDLNLNTIRTLLNEFPDPVGFSDHTEGIWASIASVALGARFIEKHFTLDKNLPGPDHALSAEPDELRAIVDGSRKVFNSLGDGVKKPTDDELKNRHLGRKGVYASKDIAPGQVLCADDVKLLRPEGEIKAADLKNVIGKKTAKPLCKGDAVIWDGLLGV
jgi:N,N'-diacetyllegionaminate synthase